MPAAKLMGIILIAVGALTLALRGFSYTRTEKILDLGPIEATAETEEHVRVPVWVGGVVIVAGVVLLLTGNSRTKTA